MATTDTPDFADFVDSQLDKAKPDDGRESIDNRERGCGHLKKNKAYIRCDASALSVPGGEIPRFVELDDPVEYREDLPLRGYGFFPGTNFSLAYAADGRTTTPSRDIHDHIDRMQRHGLQGDHYFDMPAATSNDLVMSVGETYYDDPEDFIDEARERGLNKAIPVSKNNEPPEINPLRTRVWIIHPNACGGTGGIIGYSYLTRIVYTSGHAPGESGDDPEVPGYVEEWAEAGRVDVVDRGEAIEADDEDDTPDVTLNDFAVDTPDDEDFEVDHPRERMTFVSEDDAGKVPDDPDYMPIGDDVSVTNPTTVVPSDKPGRDVEEATTTGDTPTPDEDDQSDADEADADHDVRAALEDALSYNDAKRIASHKGLEVGQHPGMDDLLGALVDAGVKPADFGGDE